MTEPQARDPALGAAAALFMDKLTTPDSEDWMILPDGNVAHVTALREVVQAGARRVMAKSGSMKLADLKATVRQLPAGHDLGCVSVILCRDAGDQVVDLLQWLTKMARKKGFSMMSHIGPVTTAEALKVRAAMLARWQQEKQA